MENYEYEKEFPFENRSELDDSAPGETECIRDFLDSYKRDLSERPHFLIPFAPLLFERTVKDCELIAKEFSGRVKATINYSHFTATIEVWCLYVEFMRDEFMSILHRITCYALSVEFQPLTTGELYIQIKMPYFVSAQEPEE